PARPFLVARDVHLARESEVLRGERLAREDELLVLAIRIRAVLPGERLARIEDEWVHQLLAVHGRDDEAVETTHGRVDTVIAEGGPERHVDLVLGRVGGKEAEERREADVVDRHRDRFEEGGVGEGTRGVRERGQWNDLRVDVVRGSVRVFEGYRKRVRERSGSQ